MYHYHYGVDTLPLALILITVNLKEIYPDIKPDLCWCHFESHYLQAALQQLKLQNSATAQLWAVSCLHHKQCLPDKPVDHAQQEGWL